MFPLVLMTVMDDDDRNYMITIYEQYQWLMLVTARRYVQTSYDQEEIISEACLALIKKIPTLRTLESKKLSAYIATTVKNKARDYLTRQNARKTDIFPWIVFHAPLPTMPLMLNVEFYSAKRLPSLPVQLMSFLLKRSRFSC